MTLIHTLTSVLMSRLPDCIPCKRAFVDRKSFQWHRLTSPRHNPDYICLRCLVKVRDSARDMRDHIAASCDGIPTRGRLVCTPCDTTFHTSAGLNSHLTDSSIHPNRISRWCAICQLLFGSLGAFRRHLSGVYHARAKKQRFVPSGLALFRPASKRRESSGE